MATALLPDSSAGQRASGPTSASVEANRHRCPGCGGEIDPIRAGHVAIFEGRFHYFCRSECKQAFLHVDGGTFDDSVETVRPPDVETDDPDAFERSTDAPGNPPDRTADDSSFESDAATVALAANVAERRALRGRGTLLAIDAAGIASGLVLPALGALGPVPPMAAVALLGASLSALLVRFSIVPRDPADSHPAVALAPVVGAVGAACYALSLRSVHAGSLAVLASLSCSAAIAVEGLVARARAHVASERARIQRALDVPVRAADGARSDWTVDEVRAGDAVLVEAGETVGVDAVVAAGEARVVPWLGASAEVVRREGEAILAGARVSSSRLRVTATWSGVDRAWVKLLGSPSTRIDVAAPTLRFVRHMVERGGLVAALLIGVAAFAANDSAVEVFAAMCAGAIAFASRAACALAALHFARAHLDALANGIVFKDARSFERSAAATIAVLSARGTVLAGEPELVAVEGLGAFESERVLALAAGAETISPHPFAAAIVRAARAGAIKADPVRNGAAWPGMGVTAVASTGERLVVGSRAMMLRQRIGVAIADARVAELEARGRSVVLVALGERIVGLVALQDHLCAGARAAIQSLLDAKIEPVLMSGDARQTCEAIGRALDVEHVRPEVLPAERGGQVRALADGGNVVAVIGHPARDDGALGAADVAIAMGAAGSAPGEWAVALAGDDVRDAARGLSLARSGRDRARAAAVIGAAPGVLALLAIGFGVAPYAAAPVAAVIGAVAAVIHAREPRIGVRRPTAPAQGGAGANAP